MLLFQLSETLTVLQNVTELQWPVQAALAAESKQTKKLPICAAVVHSQTTEICANC
jgi:hypothetical protein